MKAPAFDYIRARSLDEVFRLLKQHGDDARVLAGGQSLLATLNMRLSEPALLIDIIGLEALQGISVRGSVLRIGALATHREIEGSELVSRHAPLLTMAAPHIAHRAIRNRGTWGGSIAYGDPAAEWPACLIALEGTVVVRGEAGERRIAATDFFIDLYTTALAEGEIVVGCDIPLSQSDDVFVFDELARRHGDYAVAGVALSARRAAGGLQRVRLAFLGIGTTPIRVPRAEALLEGQAMSPALVDRAVAMIDNELEPLADLTHTSNTKRHLACVLARRALGTACPESLAVKRAA